MAKLISEIVNTIITEKSVQYQGEDKQLTVQCKLQPHWFNKKTYDHILQPLKFPMLFITDLTSKAIQIIKNIKYTCN